MYCVLREMSNEEIFVDRFYNFVQESEENYSNLFLHWDNAKPHKSNVTSKKIIDLGITELPQPAYSPDIAPSDFFLFGYLKEKLKHWKIESRVGLIEAILTEMNKIDQMMLDRVFFEWLSRLEKVVTSNGNYC